MAMGIRPWEWEEMGSKQSFPHISNRNTITRNLFSIHYFISLNSIEIESTQELTLTLYYRTYLFFALKWLINILLNNNNNNNNNYYYYRNFFICKLLTKYSIGLIAGLWPKLPKPHKPIGLYFLSFMQKQTNFVDLRSTNR